jgi:hypothetical protein
MRSQMGLLHAEIGHMQKELSRLSARLRFLEMQALAASLETAARVKALGGALAEQKAAAAESAAAAAIQSGGTCMEAVHFSAPAVAALLRTAGAPPDILPAAAGATASWRASARSPPSRRLTSMRARRGAHASGIQHARPGGAGRRGRGQCASAAEGNSSTTEALAEAAA